MGVRQISVAYLVYHQGVSEHLEMSAFFSSLLGEDLRSLAKNDSKPLADLPEEKPS